MPIAAPSRWASGSRLLLVSVAVTLMTPSTIDVKPSPWLPVETVARCRHDRDVQALELADRSVICWPGPPSWANQLWA